jgi:hypothetical protein
VRFQVSRHLRGQAQKTLGLSVYPERCVTTPWQRRADGRHNALVALIDVNDAPQPTQ